jgi:uncharacterized repeat protein (TIGR01451 family)
MAARGYARLGGGHDGAEERKRPMSKSFAEIARHPARFGVVLAVLAVALVVGLMSASAVHNETLLEVDGNVAYDGGFGANPGTAAGQDHITVQAAFDWATSGGVKGVCTRGATGNIVAESPPPAGVNASSCLADYGPNDSSYHTGGDKDIQNSSAWGCTTIANATNKDDLLNAYAIQATSPTSGHIIDYFGTERDTTNGTSFTGVWLLQNQGGCPVGGGAFTAAHTAGDVLLLFSFPSGGSTGSLAVFTWLHPVGVATCGGTLFKGTLCPDSPLTGTTLDCRFVAANDTGCGRINSGTGGSPGAFTPPWNTRPSGFSQVILANAFVEAGIDMNFYFPTGVPCFGTVVSETRSSATPDATLKDMVIAPFNTCKIPTSLATNAGGPFAVTNGTVALTDTATLTGAPATAGGTITFKLYSDATCTTLVGTSTATVTNGAVVNPSSPAISVGPGQYYWTATYSGDGNVVTSSSACGAANENPLVIAPAIQVTKTPHTQTILSGGTATWTITITNTGDTTLTNVNTTDLAAADCQKTSAQLITLGLAGATLAPGATFSYTCSLANVTAAFDNVVVACGTPSAGPVVCDNSPATLGARTGSVTPITPSIQVTKLPHSQSLVSGGTATWTITITNTSKDATLTNVSTTDALAGDCAKTSAQLITLGLTGATLAPGATFSYTCSLANVTVAFDNVVVACGTPSVGPDVCDNSNTTLDVRTGHVGVESLASLQDFKPQDSATVTVTGTGILPLNGSVTFNLYNGACTGTPIYSATVFVDASGNASTASLLLLSQLIGSTNTAGTYNWQISYSGDTNGNAAITGACGTENFTIVNG